MTEADETSSDTGEQSFICTVCGGAFGVEQVFDDQGAIICEHCFAQRAAVTRTAVSAPSPPEPPRPRPNPKEPVLLTRVTCPHCWHKFPPVQSLWVAEHSDLMGDVVLGPDAMSRFLPSRFNPAGQAIDARGMACHILACPSCHLPIPRVLLQHDPLFLSIIGVQASGKSYFLTTMAWELRKRLGREFGIAFADADPSSNRFLNEYEQTLFLPADPNQPVILEPTHKEGHLYDQVRVGRQVINLPRPILFTLRRAPAEMRILCFYDNAGEHFRPGEDRSNSPVTRHVAMSGVLMFLYDPTQDPRFRAKVRPDHPQLSGAKTERQDVILEEAAGRVRRYAGLAPDAVHRRPLIVLVGKSDVWGELLGVDIQNEPIIEQGGRSKLDIRRVEDVSRRLRKLMLDTVPEFVAAAEGFAKRVTYMPVSAIGRAPEQGGFIKPSEISPRWVTVPLLYMLANWARGWVEGVE